MYESIFSIEWFFSISIIYIGLVIIFIQFLHHFDAKLFLLVFSFFFYFYNGVGLAYKEISILLRIYFFVFYFFFSVTFICIYRLKNLNISKITYKINHLRIESFILVKIFSFFYIATILFSLIYPNLIIDRLIHPPVPDLLGTLNDFQPTNDSSKILLKIVFYLQTLCYPFFIFNFDLIKKKRSILLFLVISTVLNYVSYVRSAYISRSDIFLSLLIAIFAFLLSQKKNIIKQSIKILIPISFVVTIFSAYQQIRLGDDPFTNGAAVVFKSAFETEVGFPKDVMQKIIDKKMTTNFPNYLLWMSTLPIPKIFIPNQISFTLNKDISEKLLKIPSDDQYFYILLPGLLGESIYIYSIFCFFIHAIFCGLIFGFITKLFKKTNVYSFFYAYLFVLMSYITCRGGIVSSLPILINGNLLFILYVIFLNKIRFKQSPSIS